MFVLQNGKWQGQDMNFLGFSVVLSVTVDLRATQKPEKDLLLFEP